MLHVALHSLLWMGAAGSTHYFTPLGEQKVNLLTLSCESKLTLIDSSLRALRQSIALP